MVVASCCAFLTSKERDNESGLDYFEARYYSSAKGRFTSADTPFLGQHRGDPQSWNLYQYGRNNPLLYVDPTGNDYEIYDKDNKLIRVVRDSELGSLDIDHSNDDGTEIYLKDGTVGRFVNNPIGDSVTTEAGPWTLEDQRLSRYAAWIANNIDENGTVPDETQAPLSRLIFGQRRIPYQEIVTTNYVEYWAWQCTLSGGGCGFTIGRGGAPFRSIHKVLDNAKLQSIRRMSTEEIIESLKPGSPNALRVKPDGRIFEGNHRIQVLRERGVDVDSLPREIIP